MLSRPRRKLEFAVVTIAAGIVTGLLLERVVPLMAGSERVAFMHVRGQLQSALLLETADRIARGDAASLSSLDHANPMSLLVEPPRNYLGVLRNPAPEDVRHARWYFDESTGRLVYRVGRLATIATPAGPTDRVELVVRFIYADHDGNGRFDPRADGFEGVHLEAVRPFEWIEDDA
jgi:hypothetical protein